MVATALAAACVCLTGCGGVGGPRAADPITASPTSASEPVTPEPVTTTPDRDIPDIPISDASLLAEPVEVERPVQVLVPDLGIDVPIDSVGVAEDGQMEVPADALRAGWYRFGPSPGQAGRPSSPHMPVPSSPREGRSTTSPARNRGCGSR